MPKRDLRARNPALAPAAGIHLVREQALPGAQGAAAAFEGSDLLVAEVVQRASKDYERWAALVAQTGYCCRPIRLMGSVRQVDKTTGEIRLAYSTEAEPDGTLFIACGNRRASVCPTCAERYRADAFHLIAAGLRGGKTVPTSVASHPMVFATFTAPSFGPVHTHKKQERQGAALPAPESGKLLTLRSAFVLEAALGGRSRPRAATLSSLL